MPTLTIADQSVQVKTGTTVLAAIRTLAATGGPAVAAGCGGEGECGRCQVKVVSGDVSLPDDWERTLLGRSGAGHGIRLACRARINGDVVIELLEPRGSEVRLLEVPVAPGSPRSVPASYGAAVDLGTTTVDVSVVDLCTGRAVAASGPNPGTACGEDLLTRLSHSLNATGGRDQLSLIAVSAINRLVAQACGRVGCEPGDVQGFVIAGNTGMIHLLLGLDVSSLACAPYTPVVRGPIDMPARDLGLESAADAMVHVLPAIGGFVGGDHVAALLAADLDRVAAPTMLVDVGTNTEIAIACGGRLTSCSCASGPAFEGGAVSRGMRAGSGAIDRVWWTGNDVGCSTVDGTKPLGFCGSGLVDALSVLLSSGHLDRSGRLWTDPVAIGGVELTGPDVRQLQLAGAAIRAGVELLLDSVGIEACQLERVYVTGAFGSALNPQSAIAIGLLPPLPTGAFTLVPSLASEGSRLALCSPGHRQRAAAIARTTDHLDLAGHPRFNDVFLSHIAFPDPI